MDAANCHQDHVILGTPKHKEHTNSQTALQAPSLKRKEISHECHMLKINV